ncbi:hypothetical protein [uncultured Methanobrevibacter sp.]|uniref:hypothetical protein n=1 Tax=uncultured Methanobrevibacter sp. TaxID=253161 RepID=UPI00261C4707|nr:hypothetical protein [uncultured Methanobrevibacter sp.]
MKRLKIYENIALDSNIIIYYCFKTKETQIVEFTDKTHKLIEFLINQKVTFRVPKFIINEINRISFAEKIEGMIFKKELTNMPKDSGYFFKMKLESKVKYKFNLLQQKEWFVVEDYFPSKESIDEIHDFFEKLIVHPQIDEFLNKKRKGSQIPSFEDMALISYSNDKHYPIITNDYDLSFFKEDLYGKKLSCKIFKLSELDLYNN